MKRTHKLILAGLAALGLCVGIAGGLFVLRVFALSSAFGTPEGHLKEFRTQIELVCQAEELQRWADQMFASFPTALEKEEGRSGVSEGLIFEPLRNRDSLTPARCEVGYAESGEPESINVVWAYGRLIEGVSIYSSPGSGKKRLTKRGTHYVEIGPRVFVWQAYN